MKSSRKPKIGNEVVHVTCNWRNCYKIKKVKGQGHKAYNADARNVLAAYRVTHLVYLHSACSLV